MSIKEVREKVKKYKELKADIVDIDIKIAETEEEYIGITACPQGERTSQTYKITSSVENQAEKHQEAVEKLLHLKFIKENQIKRIDNALSILDETHKEVIQSVLIENKRYSYVQEKLHLSYQRVKAIESEGLREMQRYIR